MRIEALMLCGVLMMRVEASMLPAEKEFHDERVVRFGFGVV